MSRNDNGRRGSSGRRGGAGKRRSLDDKEIVTRPGVARRSALQIIGAAAVGATALVSGGRPAKADRFDVTIVGDPPSDRDSGPFADPPGDADIAVKADGAAAGVGRPAPERRPAQPSGDPKSTDTDFGANSDRFDADAAPAEPAPREPAATTQPAQASGDPKSTDTDFGANADRFDADQAPAAAPPEPTVDPGPAEPVPTPPAAETAPPAPRSGDADVSRFGDPADQDSGSRADPADTDVSTLGDPKPGG